MFVVEDTASTQPPHHPCHPHPPHLAGGGSRRNAHDQPAHPHARAHAHAHVHVSVLLRVRALDPHAHASDPRARE